MTFKQRIVAVVVGVIVLFGVTVTKSYLSFAEQEKQRARFTSHIATYLQTDVAADSSDSPYLRGKLVTVDVEKGEVDYWTYPKLPDEIKAVAPEEVQTVGLIEWGWEKVGHYEDAETGQQTGDAFQSYGRLTLIDWIDKTRIAEVTFQGDAPVQSLSYDGDFKGWQPMFKVVDYLTELPRR